MLNHLTDKQTFFSLRPKNQHFTDNPSKNRNQAVPLRGLACWEVRNR